MSGDTAAAAVVGLQAAASIDRYAIRSPDPEQSFLLHCMLKKQACVHACDYNMNVILLWFPQPSLNIFAKSPILWW